MSHDFVAAAAEQRRLARLRLAMVALGYSLWRSVRTQTPTPSSVPADGPHGTPAGVK